VSWPRKNCSQCVSQFSGLTEPSYVVNSILWNLGGPLPCADSGAPPLHSRAHGRMEAMAPHCCQGRGGRPCRRRGCPTPSVRHDRARVTEGGPTCRPAQSSSAPMAESGTATTGNGAGGSGRKTKEATVPSRAPRRWASRRGRRPAPIAGTMPTRAVEAGAADAAVRRTAAAARDDAAARC